MGAAWWDVVGGARWDEVAAVGWDAEAVAQRDGWDCTVGYGGCCAVGCCRSCTGGCGGRCMVSHSGSHVAGHGGICMAWPGSTGTQRGCGSLCTSQALQSTRPSTKVPPDLHGSQLGSHQHHPWPGGCSLPSPGTLGSKRGSPFPWADSSVLPGQALGQPPAPAAPSCLLSAMAPPRPGPAAVLLPKEPLWDTMACFYGNYEHGKNKCMHL